MTALVIGGAEGFADDYTLAVELAPHAEHFLINDQMATFAAPAGSIGVTLHPAKLNMWLTARAAAGLDAIGPVWSWAPHPGTQVTHWIRDWGGSSGLLGVRAAFASGHRKIILCGIPMTPAAGHFLRHRDWPNAIDFRRGWLAHHGHLAAYVRSCSGWTRDQLGAPSAEWLAADPPGMMAVTAG